MTFGRKSVPIIKSINPTTWKSNLCSLNGYFNLGSQGIEHIRLCWNVESGRETEKAASTTQNFSERSARLWHKRNRNKDGGEASEIRVPFRNRIKSLVAICSSRFLGQSAVALNWIVFCLMFWNFPVKTFAWRRMLIMTAIHRGLNYCQRNKMIKYAVITHASWIR